MAVSEINTILLSIKRDLNGTLQAVREEDTKAQLMIHIGGHMVDIDKALALTAALSDQVVDWQPIETAPKDGTDVLVVNAGASTPAATVAHFWNEKCWVCCHSEDYTDTLHGEIGIMGFPTHWQPLPEPPPVPASTPVRSS